MIKWTQYQINLESVGDVEYPVDGGMFIYDTEKWFENKPNNQVLKLTNNRKNGETKEERRLTECHVSKG